MFDDGYEDNPKPDPEFINAQLIKRAEFIENDLLEAQAVNRIKDYEININFDDGAIEVKVIPEKIKPSTLTDKIKENLKEYYYKFKDWLHPQ